MLWVKLSMVDTPRFAVSQAMWVSFDEGEAALAMSLLSQKLIAGGYQLSRKTEATTNAADTMGRIVLDRKKEKDQPRNDRN